MPNLFAYFVLFSWPLVAMVLFARLPTAQALSWAIVSGYLLLPGVGIDLQGLPAIDKSLIIALSAWAVCIFSERRIRNMNRRSALNGAAVPRLDDESARLHPGLAQPLRLTLWLLVVCFALLSPLFSALNNREALYYGPRLIPSMSNYDAFTMAFSSVAMLIPMMLGVRFFRSGADISALLRVIVLAGLGYSLLALIEVRMSPQMSNWIYGFFPHSFLQHFRAGGYRPIVFLPHGLILAVFFATAALASLGLWRMTRSRDRRASTRYLWASVWLALTLVLCKSFGALILFLTLAPLIIFSSPRRLALVLGAVGLLFLLYPAARAADWIPVDRLISAVRGISQDRSDSLRTRVLNEDTLLARASEKPLTGWGSWGRNRIYDVESGRDLSLTDGYWIMVLGTQGWFGFGAVSVLLAYALLRYLRAKNRIRESDQLTPRMTLYVLIALVLLDALPNASISEVTWLLVGCAWASLSFPIAAGAAIRQPKRLRGHRTLLHASS